MECFYIVTVGWVFSVCLHEFAHALVAYKSRLGFTRFSPLPPNQRTYPESASYSATGWVPSDCTVVWGGVLSSGHGGIEHGLLLYFHWIVVRAAPGERIPDRCLVDLGMVGSGCGFDSGWLPNISRSVAALIGKEGGKMGRSEDGKMENKSWLKAESNVECRMLNEG
jgi:hypothetical protein